MGEYITSLLSSPYNRKAVFLYWVFLLIMLFLLWLPVGTMSVSGNTICTIQIRKLKYVKFSHHVTCRVIRTLEVSCFVDTEGLGSYWHGVGQERDKIVLRRRAGENSHSFCSTCKWERERERERGRKGGRERERDRDREREEIKITVLFIIVHS